ncbi:MAG: alpha/beta fold hydrolase, partial [Pseudomonadota bacterium]
MRRRSVTCLNPGGQHRMAYVEWGPVRADRTVVCAHGLVRTGRDFDELAQVFAERGWRVVCPDVVGRGKSDWLSNAMLYGYPQYLSDMNTLLARLDGPVDWVGTSMGGLIGMMLAGNKDVAIRSLVMNDVGPFIPYAALERIGDYVGKERVFADLAEAEKHFRVICAPFGDLTDRQWAHMVRHSVRPLAEGGLGFAYDPAIASGFSAVTGDVDLWTLWDTVQCPVMVVRGAESDLLLPDTLERMAERSVPTKTVTFEGCGHAPALMSADQTTPIADWVSEQASKSPVPGFVDRLPPLSEKWPWKGGDLQTVRNRLRGHRATLLPAPETLEFEMPDGTGDRLIGALSRPTQETGGKPLAVLLHGLTGCEDSHYVVEAALRLLDQGHPVMRLNLRGAGPARKTCRFQYHAGRSEDLRAVFDQLDRVSPG